MAESRSGWTGRWNRRAIWTAYAATVGLFLWAFARFYDPIGGFAYLIDFGTKQNLPQISAMQPLNYSLQNDGYGYDAQYYVQIAMHPSLREPELASAIDAPAYRARRILFGWTAYVLGAGRPAGILQAYAVQGAIAWLVLAVVLLRWFPATSWENLFRWAGVLFCGGMCVSLRNALVDGPSLLLIAAGVWCVEKNRPWLATAVFGLSGLGRETNVLGAASLADPGRRTARDWLRLVVRAALVAAPLAVWLVYVQLTLGKSMDAGARNFDPPLMAFLGKWRDTLAGLAVPGREGEPARLSLWLMIAVTVQAGFILARPSWRQPWWRVGACYAALMVVLGASTWEGDPGAAGRLLLPLQLAFNVLVPRGRAWLVVLALGNLTLIGVPAMMQPPVGDGYVLNIAPKVAEAGTNVRVVFDRAWFGAENRNGRTWRWAKGTGKMTVINSGAAPAALRLEFHLDCLPGDRREMGVVFRGQEVWRGMVAGDMPDAIVLSDLVLPPGPSVVTIESGGKSILADARDGRSLAFALRDLKVSLVPAAE